MALDPMMIGNYRAAQARFTINHATRPLVLVGGSNDAPTRVHALNVIHQGASANSLVLYYGHRMSLLSSAAAGSTTLTKQTNDTLTRTTGSFIADGWKVDDRLFIKDPTNLLNQAFYLVTAVTATTLTFSGSPSGASETLPVTAELHRMTILSTSTLPVSAGNAGGTASVDLLSDMKPFVDASPDRFIMLGRGALLVGNMGTALAASLACETTAFVGEY